MSFVVGVDEAGKGPVFGSMFAAAVRVPAAADGAGRPAPDALPDGVDDSKRLAPERREELAAALRADDRVGVGVAEVPVERIDAPETDMNGLTVRAHAAAVDRVADDGDRGCCDAADVDPDRFARRVASAASADVRVDADHGADRAHAAVAAASVVAKVERDAHVAALAADHGDVGSGYPSDPTTREFLERYVGEHGSLPAFARSTWATCEDVLAAAEQTDLGGFGGG